MKVAYLYAKTASSTLVANTINGRVMKVMLGGITGPATAKTPLKIEVREGVTTTTGNVIGGFGFPITSSTNIQPNSDAFTIDLGPSGIKFAAGLHVKITQGTGTSNATVQSIGVMYE